MKKISDFLRKYKYPFLTIICCSLILVFYHNCAKVGQAGGVPGSLGPVPGSTPLAPVAVVQPVQLDQPAQAVDNSPVVAPTVDIPVSPSPTVDPSTLVTPIPTPDVVAVTPTPMPTINPLCIDDLPFIAPHGDDYPPILLTINGTDTNSPEHIQSITIDNIAEGSIVWADKFPGSGRTDSYLQVEEKKDANGKNYLVLSVYSTFFSDIWTYLYMLGGIMQVINVSEIDLAANPNPTTIRNWNINDGPYSNNFVGNQGWTYVPFALINCSPDGKKNFYLIIDYPSGYTPPLQ